MKRVVLLGGGHAHIEVLRDLQANPDGQLHVLVVTPYPWLIYTGMLPGHIAGHYALEECTIDLAALARAARADLRLTTASLVSPDANEVVCADGSVHPYDVLSLDVGSQPVLGAARGVQAHAIVVRPLERAVQGWNEVYARAAKGRLKAITVVGGGAGGIELALAMNHRLRTTLEEPVPHVRLVSDAAGVGLAAGARRRLVRRMRRNGVASHVGAAVAEVGRDFLRLDSGLEFTTDAVFWATGAGAHPWIRDSGLATDERGFLLTNDRLQSVSHSNVFGAGDCATDPDHPRPRAGVFAVRAAPILAANLRAAIHGQPLQPFRPPGNFLALISTGERHAVGTWGPLSWQGRWAWRWKDRIDRRFVAQYRAAKAS
ncbi:MAG: FAD-dependent oxidoreductase [Pseudomonadota bacterium]|nr:FAD-dependent oxidoreductase [Pseudomonadota bacterium]